MIAMIKKVNYEFEPFVMIQLFTGDLTGVWTINHFFFFSFVLTFA